jgi:hypothetical protein
MRTNFPRSSRCCPCSFPFLCLKAMAVATPQFTLLQFLFKPSVAHRDHRADVHCLVSQVVPLKDNTIGRRHLQSTIHTRPYLEFCLDVALASPFKVACLVAGLTIP